MLTYAMKYALASTLSVSSVEHTISQINKAPLSKEEYAEAVQLVKTLDKMFPKKNGFIPKPVLKYIKEN